MALPPEMREALPGRMAALLDREDAAKDIAALSLRAAGLAHLDRRDGGEERHRGAAALARLGFRRGEAGTRQSGLEAPAP